MKTRHAVFALLPAFLLSLGLMACAPEQAAPAPEAAQAVFAPAEPTAEAVSAPSPAPVTEAPARETETPGETAPPPETEAPAETAPPEAPDDRDPLQAAVEACATAEKTNQIVLAVDHALTFWEKAEDGSWQKRMEAACGYGKNGLVLGEERIMGSKTTPIGAFPLTLAFGTGENPGTEMTWRQITENSYWTEVEDESFNTWVESETPVPGEHLIDYYQYKYAVNIGFNLEDMVYSRGSAIFLHCKSADHWDTAGCVSLAEEDMLNLLRMLRDGAYMIIVPDAESIGDY
jgi:L,D-peptidoglycan transpeptidase YkuD (ErfK/YbiS/YcfS/YnhG family)